MLLRIIDPAHLGHVGGQAYRGCLPFLGGNRDGSARHRARGARDRSRGRRGGDGVASSGGARRLVAHVARRTAGGAGGRAPPDRRRLGEPRVGGRAAPRGPGRHPPCARGASDPRGGAPGVGGEGREVIRRLSTVLAGGASKGRAGENVLREHLAQLPPGMLVTDFRVGGKVVEFGLLLPDGRRLPIDSKWTAVAELEAPSHAARTTMTAQTPGRNLNRRSTSERTQRR